MFTPKQSLGISRARTPRSGLNQSPAGKRRTSLLAQLGGAGVRKTPTSSRRSATPLGTSGLGAVTQPSFVLEETETQTVEPYGATLPVTVIEILTLSEKISDVSVSLSPNGWAWLVYCRRLVVWRYIKPPTGGSKWVGAYCRELTLPPSDLAHSAKLVNVFAASETQTPSCIAVSPEGTVRYWPSIAHEGSSYEVNADLQGQECCSLTDLQPLGSVLATTTATVLLVQLENVSGQHSLACRQLKPPQGILGGIGRRVSSLLWGGMPTSSSSETKLVQVLGGDDGDGEPFERTVFVLTSSGLQKWWVVQGDPERLVYSSDLENIAKQAFATHTWGHANADPSWIKVFILDMQLTSDGLMVLMAANNPNISEHLHYGLGTLRTFTDSPPVQFIKFVSLKHTNPYCETEDAITQPGLNYRFLLPASANYQTAYVYNENGVICFSAVSESEEPEHLDLNANGNMILGTGSSSDERPLFFTVTSGLVTFTPNAASADKTNITFNESLAGGKASLLSDSLNISISQAGLENLTMSESKRDQLKAAFLLFCKRDFNQATSIVEDLFPSDDDTSSVGSRTLDRLVVAMSTDLIDDFPASDPRWMETVPGSEAGASTAIGSTRSLLILYQLKDKGTALEIYITFLKEVGLWNRLSGITCRELTMSTSLILREHFERIEAAITLRKLHSEYESLMDRAIKEILKHRQLPPDTANLVHLTPQDHFYRQISKIGEFVEGFQRVEQEEFISSKSPIEVVATVLAVNKIILTVIRECLRIRSKNLQEFQIEEFSRFEYQPWTSAPGPRGLRTYLLRQYHITLEKAVPISEDAVTRTELYHQLVDLSDMILDGYRTQLDSISNEDRKLAIVYKHYEKDRSSLIMPLVKHGCLEEAASLAEKYFEFSALVKICELTNDNARLERYMDQFADHDFSDFVFDWHVREGKQSKLLGQSYSSHRQEKLGKFLEGHSSISWLHDIQTERYSTASQTLERLAINEVKNVAKKKTFLSLAKLAALASGAADEQLDAVLDRIDDSLMIVIAQEQLPANVIEANGVDPKKMRVMSPVELIELYTGEDNTTADYIDFKKALDLLDHLPAAGYSPQEYEEEKERLKLKIWSRALRRDQWESLDTNDPINVIAETTFFKLVELCYTQNMDIFAEVPGPDQLFVSEELSDDLKKNLNFQFLIRTGFEHLHRQTTS